ncbi:PRC-barrel domain containing protein [Streptomyces sp. NBC_00433]
MTDKMWAYQATAGHRAGSDLSGFKVEATDGGIGRVSKYSDTVDSSYLVVDTGIWILGKHVLLPAGTVTSVDVLKRRILVARSKDDIKNAPEFDRSRATEDDAGYREQVGTYYGTPRN